MLNNVVPLPGNFTFSQWVNELNTALTRHNVPVHSDHKEWKDWVYDFMSINPSLNITLPFTNDWKIWVPFFITDVNSS